MIYHNDDVQELRPTGGQRGVFNLINSLRESTNNKPSSQYADLTLPLKHLRRVAKPGTMIFVISDFWTFNDDVQNELSQLSRHNDVFCTVISDPVELNHLPSGRYPIQSIVGDSLLDTKSKQRRTLLQNFLDERLDNIQTFCRKRQLSLLHVSTTDAVPQALLAQMGRKSA